jgi:hypothetical protein
MSSRNQRSGMPASLAKLNRRQAQAARRRRLELRHTAIAVVGAVVAMAVVAISSGLVPAIAAARGQGMSGTFVVGYENCSVRYGCTWVGTFQASNGLEVPDVAYKGSLPPGTGQGQRIPARYPGGSSQVFALHGSHNWVMDLLLMIFVGAAVAAALWISPLGMRGRALES